MNCNSRDIDHWSAYCNCGTCTVLERLNHRASVVAHNGRVNDLVQARIRVQLWDLDQFLTACTRELLDLRNRDVKHLINGMQLVNLSGLLRGPRETASAP